MLKLAFLGLSVVLTFSSSAWAKDRALTLKNTSSGEVATAVYKTELGYSKQGLDRLQSLLHGETGVWTDLEPELFELLWKIAKEVGAEGKPISILTAYKPATLTAYKPATSICPEKTRDCEIKTVRPNQHTMGKAMDFFIENVDLKELRDAALIQKAGGVGYYPNADTPFIHIDTGRVRSWPKFSKNENGALFGNQ